MNRKERTVIVAIGANLLLIGLKFFLASLSGSVAVKASAWHSFSDLIPSAVVLIGLVLARRENTAASRGVSRIENIIAIIVSGFIFYVGIEIVREVLAGPSEELTNVPLVAVISLLTIGITYFMARYQIFVGRETNSPGLIANGTHARVDMYSSIVVVAALIGYTMGLAALDKIAAVIIVLLIFSNGLEVLRSGIGSLRRGGFLDFTHLGEEVLFERFTRWMRRFAVIGLALLAVVYLASGIYAIGWDEEGVVKRFGRPVRLVEPGLHYRLPWPLEAVDRVGVADVRVEEIPSSLMLTGDENLLEIKAVVHYRVKDILTFIYNQSNPDDLVRNIVESTLRHQINRNSIDRILTEGKTEIQEEAMRFAQLALDEQDAGVELLTVQLTKDAPPEGVMEAFRDVASAREDKNTYINDALAYQSEIVPKTRGEAQRSIEEALAYRGEKLLTATGDAARFLSRLGAYQRNPSITRKRLYIEGLEKSLTNIDKVILDQSVEIDNTELWFLKDDLGTKIFGEGQRR